MVSLDGHLVLSKTNISSKSALKIITMTNISVETVKCWKYILLVGWSMKPEKSDKIHYNRSAPENAGPPLVKRENCACSAENIHNPAFIFQPGMVCLYSNPARNSLSLIFAEAWLTDRLGSVFNIGDTQQQTQYTDLQTLCRGNKKSRPWLCAPRCQNDTYLGDIFRPISEAPISLW